MNKIIKVDADIAELVPLYLRNRRAEAVRAAALLEAADFRSLQAIGHGLKGSGGGYGLDFISELGGRLENSAKECDKSAVAAQLAELKDFLDTVRIETIPAK